MSGTRRGRVAAAVVSTAGILIAGAVAYGATHSFSGRTSQSQPISMRISGGYVRKLDYRIIDKCRRGRRLINHDFGFSPIRIRHAKFSGTFVDPTHDGKAIVKGSVAARFVAGTLSDRTRNAATRRLCTGSASFHIRRG